MKQFLRISVVATTLAITLNGCIVAEGMRALRANTDAIDMSTQSIMENADAIEQANYGIQENRRQIDLVNKRLDEMNKKS